MSTNTNMHNLTTLIKRYGLGPSGRYSIIPAIVVAMERPIAAPKSRLTVIYRRLEAATSRLEDMATSVDSSHPSTVAAISSSAGAPQDSSTTGATGAAPSAELLPPSIEDFDKVIDQDVKAFVNASAKIGGLVEQQAGHWQPPYIETPLTHRCRPEQWLKLLLLNELISM